MVKKIVIASYDEKFREDVGKKLAPSDFVSFLIANCDDLLKLCKKTTIDAILLDISLQKSCEKIVIQIKNKYPSIVVIICAEKSQSALIANILSIGADGYVIKPIDSDVLQAVIKVRLKDSSEDKFIADGLELDNKTYRVTRDNEEIVLSPYEFKLLHYLLKNKGRVLTREMILNRVWLYSYEVNSRVVDVYIGYLRKKIDSHFKKKLIHSIRGFGYMLKD